MSEHTTHSPENHLDILVSKVRESENAKEEAWEERFLAENLFHDKFLDATLHGTEDRIKLLNLEHEFLEEKRGKNMGEKFDLALSDKYLGKIHVVELGRTTNPGAHREVDGLKSGYRDLLRWMVQQGIVKDEIPREASGRNVSARQPVAPEAIDRLAIVVRNRPLIDTTIDHGGHRLDIAITKRMVFGMPPQALATIYGLHGNLNTDLALSHIERLLEHAPDAITPIRTAYYLATDIK